MADLAELAFEGLVAHVPAHLVAALILATASAYWKARHRRMEKKAHKTQEPNPDSQC
ncbi:hypothetical protein GCM10012289_07670 [Nonomuraea cavernae]|uniref:Uncharacterized protein n=1 Tax=Nonomuraea cavernae TaxID=2045107 RepID=A0A918DFE4_9ACTN|nr:hypothetical protein GCM10012289_07670 [Nonomuraea cavernae]